MFERFRSAQEGPDTEHVRERERLLTERETQMKEKEAVQLQRNHSQEDIISALQTGFSNDLHFLIYMKRWKRAGLCRIFRLTGQTFRKWIPNCYSL